MNQAPDNPTNEEDVQKTIPIIEDYKSKTQAVPFLKVEYWRKETFVLKYYRLMFDGQEYTYDYDIARTALARK